MQVRIEHNSEGMFVRLSGEIDHHSARSLREQVDAAIDRHHPKQLMLDFGDVSFMDSSGIGFVMGRYRIMQSIGGKLQVIHISDRLFKVMKLAGLERLGILPQTQEVKPNETHK